MYSVDRQTYEIKKVAQCYSKGRYAIFKTEKEAVDGALFMAREEIRQHEKRIVDLRIAMIELRKQSF